jgi:UDP-glucose 4-epimerase
VHCAGYLVVSESVHVPGDYYINNVAKTANFLSKLTVLPKIPVVVFSSSAAVYGNPSQLPITETSPIQPMSPYGHSKAMTEQMLSDFDRAYGLKSACLRYFNACGADPYDAELGQEPGATHIIARLLDAQLTQQQFTIFGTDFNTPDGTCVRDYVHVWDLATAHILAIEYLLEHKTSVKLNLGTNLGVSNREVVGHVNAIAGTVNFDLAGRRSGDPDKLVADATLAGNLLNWQPQYSTLPMIVDTAWRWYQKRGK